MYIVKQLHMTTAVSLFAMFPLTSVEGLSTEISGQIL